MRQITDSNMKKKVRKILRLIEDEMFWRRKCPTIIFPERRSDKVTGRIMFDMVSTRIITGVIQIGVLERVSWSIIFSGYKILQKIVDSQIVILLKKTRSVIDESGIEKGTKLEMFKIKIVLNSRRRLLSILIRGLFFERLKLILDEGRNKRALINPKRRGRENEYESNIIIILLISFRDIMC